MYQSLYRKYRPSNFDEVIGQKVIVQTLKHAVANNKIAHAYLFTGPRGTGKTSIAKILAKTVNCENLSNLLPCNKCVSCTQINNKQSIDILEIDAASNNGVDEIREINNKVNLVPSTGKYKVYIIDEVHMLTTGAFNALLKTLEEPPSHIIFILATTEPHKIPSTILSRCQRFDFKKISTPEIEKRIKFIVEQENINISEEAINEIAKMSDGGMRDSLSMLDQVIAYANDNITIDAVHEVNGSIPNSELQKIILNISQGNLEEILHKIDYYDEQGKDFLKLTEELIQYLTNLLLYQTVPNYFKDNNNLEFFSEIKISNNSIMKYIKSLNQLILEMKLSNNPKLNFELLFIQLIDEQQNLSQIKDIKTIEQSIIEQPKEEKKQENSIINTKNESSPIIKNQLNEKLENIKKIRINNTLCSFNKKQINEIKNNLSGLMGMMMNDKYSDLYSLLLDGELKAVGNNNLIFVYQSPRISIEFNNKLSLIDKMLQEKLNSKYKAVAVSQEEWQIIKDEFNNKKKIYKYIEEPVIEIEKEENIIEDLFDSIVEYN